jgi:hypothetical protein
MSMVGIQTIIYILKHAAPLNENTKKHKFYPKCQAKVDWFGQGQGVN